MQLNNFGSILGFAELLETKDEAFYRSAVKNSECAPYNPVFEQMIRDCQKNLKIIQRTRRENVTEMILEGISDFASTAYELEHGAPEDIKATEIIQTARNLEERAKRYYADAAEKIRALPEVSRALKQLAKKRTAHLNALSSITLR